MNNTEFATRLNRSLDKEGFPPKHRGRIQLLAEMVGLTHRGASKWVNGQSAPPTKKYPLLAQKLNVNELWLRTGEGSMLPTPLALVPPTASHQIVPVTLYHMSTFLAEEKPIERVIPCAIPGPGPFFGITLDTEAMSPRFPKGSIIIFEESLVKDGDFVLVNYHGLPAPLFRQLLIVGGVLYLNAHNPKFDRLILSDNKRILGKLAQAVLFFA